MNNYRAYEIQFMVKSGLLLWARIFLDVAHFLLIVSAHIGFYWSKYPYNRGSFYSMFAVGVNIL
jgi:hypothetical protein